MMNYPDEFELEIESMAQGGAGVGRYAGGVVFATGGLPGERVRVRVHERKATYARAHVAEVLTPAPERIAPRLPGADHMPWQHIAYPAQLRFKQTILREQLAKLAGLTDAPVAAVIPAVAPWGYRNSAQLHVQAGRIGYYAAESHHVVDLEEDPLLLPVLNQALAGLRALLPGLGDAVATVTLRGSSAYGYAIATLRGSGDPARLAEIAARWRGLTGALAGVAINPAAGRGARGAGRRAEAAVTLHEEMGGVVFVLGPESFFQANTAQAEELLRVVRAALALQPGQRLLDAYSGAGAFALPLARGLREVVAIEENSFAVADGEQSAQLNAITNVQFVAAPVERALPDITAPLDAVVLDPPRRGCHPSALEALVALAPARIAYVSCHPGILARDLRPLLGAGYRLDLAQPVDLFPQTPHIECVAVLTRAAT